MGKVVEIKLELKFIACGAEKKRRSKLNFKIFLIKLQKENILGTGKFAANHN